MHKKVIIIGAGGHAKVIADIIEKSGDQIVGFLDDKIEKNTIIVKDYKVIGDLNSRFSLSIANKDYEFITAIGDNKRRKEISTSPNLKFYTAIHPSAQIGLDVKIEEGTAIMANACINSSARIGKHCIINTGAIIEHDNIIENFVHISPNSALGGTVRIGENRYRKCSKEQYYYLQKLHSRSRSSSCKKYNKSGDLYWSASEGNIVKILILANNDLGLYNFRKELIEEFIELEHEVYISLPNGPKILELEKIGCKYIETTVDRRGINPINDLKLLFKYIKIIMNIEPNYVLTYTIKPNIYGGIACRIKKVKQIANITGLGTALENKGFLQKIAIFLHKIALKNVYCCFAQNEENLKFLQNHKIANNKLKLIPGSGVNLEKYKLLEYPKEDDPIEFLFISRIMKEKGIDQYLETAEYIKSKYSNTKFHILGFCEQEYNEKLNELQNKNIIEYHGRQDNIIPFMQKASCIIHPTYYPEGMSNVLLEACASGRPIITTNRAGCREIVDNGINGYVIKEKDSKDLIEKVEKFINLSNEEKKQMGLAGRRKVENEFDRNLVIQEYLEEIEYI